ncbi:MAG: hypothetical protein QNJ00_06800 [Woeseiaceae bacterium]|nr:hypothetical protein [Woeseiaceae bacterium]
MKLPISILSLLALTACGGQVTTAGPGKENEAVLDFVATSELPAHEKIQLEEQIKYIYVNDYFVVVPTRRGKYLVEFRGRCSELRRPKWTSDMIDHRVSARLLYADHDTIRGCRIGVFYELSEPKFNELAALGDAPGAESYLPEKS